MRTLLLLGDFGLPTMAALLASRHRLVCVVLATATEVPRPLTLSSRVRACIRPLLLPGTPEPAPRDFRPWTAPEVLQRARVPCVAAKGLDSLNLCRLVETHKADLLLSVGYPRVLSPSVLAAAPDGGVNVHPSLLPRYRGPSPVFWQVALGETRSGVTVHRMTSGVDEGPILAQIETRIGVHETSGALFPRLARLAARLVIETLDRLEVGPIAERVQDPAAASFQRRFRIEDSLIDWSRPAEDIARLVRACNPFPGARTFLADGENVRIWWARAVIGTVRERFGEIVALRRRYCVVATSSGLLQVETATSDRGHRFPAWGRPWPTLVRGVAFTP